MGKEDVVYIHNGILFSHKKNERMPFARNIDGIRDYHIEWSQIKTNLMYHLYMESLKNNINELIYKTEIDSDVENKFIVTRGDNGGELEWLGDKLGVWN